MRNKRPRLHPDSCEQSRDHSPPYFHIAEPDFHVLVRISNLAVIAGETYPTDIAEALARAQARQELLALEWAQLIARGCRCPRRLRRASVASPPTKNP